MATYRINYKEDNIIKNFEATYSPSEMLVVNKALRLLMDNSNVHSEDKVIAEILTYDLRESFGREL